MKKIITITTLVVTIVLIFVLLMHLHSHPSTHLRSHPSTVQAQTVATAIYIASGTASLGTSAISSATCATVVTSAATGTVTTDNVIADFNGDPTAITGFIPTTTGTLTIYKYPTVDNVNFKVCNSTGSSITPGSITLNWRVLR